MEINTRAPSPKNQGYVLLFQRFEKKGLKTDKEVCAFKRSNRQATKQAIKSMHVSEDTEMPWCKTHFSPLTCIYIIKCVQRPCLELENNLLCMNVNDLTGDGEAKWFMKDHFTTWHSIGVQKQMALENSTDVIEVDLRL